MIFKIKRTGYTLGENIKIADTMISRMIGLMFVKEMKNMDGLLIDPCNSIHNCFVRFPIDVIFIDRDYKVVKVLRNFKPWRFSWIYFKAKRTLELPKGKLPEDIKVGDELEVTGV